MVKAPWALVLALLLLLPSATVAPAPVLDHGIGEKASLLFDEIGLEGLMAPNVFTAGYASIAKRRVPAHVLAIADMTQPSTAKRLYLIDLDKKELIMRTWVAHGSGSGELMCTSFSNREGSHATSKGLYRVGAEIVSPKHGAALMLQGLDRGVNCQAESREVIMHSADYVSADFIAQHGRLGRSWGCPALSREDMPRVIELLANGGYLYVHGR
ncbi:MAG: murein L,D-transpeptidase catalytic domain family protein [Flavobacteriales bacterium]|nr:murein L,D-transpeptidase catalytic domain family protein [Flavobacteriales bacterium]